MQSKRNSNVSETIPLHNTGETTGPIRRAYRRHMAQVGRALLAGVQRLSPSPCARVCVCGACLVNKATIGAPRRVRTVTPRGQRRLPLTRRWTGIINWAWTSLFALSNWPLAGRQLLSPTQRSEVKNTTCVQPRGSFCTALKRSTSFLQYSTTTCFVYTTMALGQPIGRFKGGVFARGHWLVPLNCQFEVNEKPSSTS